MAQIKPVPQIITENQSQQQTDVVSLVINANGKPRLRISMFLVIPPFK